MYALNAAPRDNAYVDYIRNAIISNMLNPHFSLDTVVKELHLNPTYVRDRPYLDSFVYLDKDQNFLTSTSRYVTYSDGTFYLYGSGSNTHVFSFDAEGQDSS